MRNCVILQPYLPVNTGAKKGVEDFFKLAK